MTELEIIDTGEVVRQMTAEEASSITTQIVVKLDAIADNYQAVMPLIREALTRQAHLALGYLAPGAYVADRFGRALARIAPDSRRAFVAELTAAGMSTRQIAPVFSVDQKTIVNDRRRLAGEELSSPDPDPVLTQEDCEALDDTEWCDGSCGEGMCECVAGECSCGGFDAAYNDAWQARDWDEVARLQDEERAQDELSEPEPKRITGTDGKSYPAPKPSREKPNRRPITDAFRDAAYDLGKRVTTLTNLVDDDRFKRNAGQLAERNLSELARARDALQRVIDQLTT